MRIQLKRGLGARLQSSWSQSVREQLGRCLIESLEVRSSENIMMLPVLGELSR